MRKPMAKKVLAASMAAAMTMSFAACEKAPASVSESAAPASTEPEVSASVEEEVSPYTVLKDANGNTYDLGGVEIIIRDWFSNAERQEAKTEFEEAQYAYQDWIQETYNFKIHAETIGDWGTVAQDFVDYATAGGDDKNYVFTLHSGDGTLLSAIDNGLVYDLSTLDCLDFSEAKWSNGVHKLYTVNGGIYAFRAGWAEPRTGLYFNKKILREAGV
ncbi:MAG: hypothetical protein IKX87_05400, partial [Lachnospiraceae bacterium]|nr:hypothetical protein [Lachnospiraceae bacterium]